MPLSVYLLETTSSQGQDTGTAVRRTSNRRKQKTRVIGWQASAGFSRINGDSMYTKHVIFQVLTPAVLGGGQHERCEIRG